MLQPRVSLQAGRAVNRRVPGHVWQGRVERELRGHSAAGGAAGRVGRRRARPGRQALVRQAQPRKVVSPAAQAQQGVKGRAGSVQNARDSSSGGRWPGFPANSVEIPRRGLEREGRRARQEEGDTCVL
eukprot:353284-Chlamydomonas_euryale.AAC.6